MSAIHFGSPSSYSFEVSKWADTLIPAAIIAVAFLLSISSTVPIPGRVLRLWRWLTAPFRNFLTIDDLWEPVDRTPRRTGVASRILVGIAAVEFVAWTTCLGYTKYMDDLRGTAKSLVFSLAWGYIALTLLMKPPLTPPYLFLLFTASVFAFAAVSLVDDVFLPDNFRLAGFHVLTMVGPLAFMGTASTLPLKTYKPSINVAGTKDIPSVTLTCPEDGVTLWTWCTFSFIQPILDLASTRTLHAPDVWSLSPFFGHKNLYRKYSAYRAKYPSHSIIRFLVKSNSLDLILSIVLDYYSTITGFLPFYALRRIIDTREASNPDLPLGFKWTMVIFVAHLSFAWKDLFQNWHQRRAYERTRGQLMNTIQEKALKKRDNTGKTQAEGEKENADLGKIVNLMQADVYSVAQRFWELSSIFAIPLRIAISMVFLFKLFGWSGLVGVLVVIVCGIFYWPLVQYEVSIQRAQLVAKDIRMRRIDEMFQNIRFLKFFGWEYEWSRRSNDAREEELKWRVRANTVDSFTNFIWVWMPLATTLGTFMSYTLLERKALNVADAFTALGLFQQLQTPMIAFPGQVKAMYQAYLSLQRIEEFMSEDEVPGWASTLLLTHDHRPAEPGIGFVDATFEWSAAFNDAAPVRFQLGPLNVSFPLDKLTVVSGATGSGKSALLVALLGEMHQLSGQVIIDKSNHQVAYCAQRPWLESLTIRDNIIFGSAAPFDDTRYQAVLDACALRPDLAILKGGDRTEIGEKGIALSGGQRARIALARAMYSQAKYILLDDPLASVDMHTASHLVHNCLGSELARGRTIVLVTHHVSLCLPVASYLLKLGRGQVVHQGTITDLKEQGILARVVESDDEDPQDSRGALSLERSRGPAPDSRDNDGKLIEDEQRAEGRVSLRSYLTYMRAGGIAPWILTFMLMLSNRVIEVANMLFLAKWTEANDESSYPAARTPNGMWKYLPSPRENVKPWLFIYFLIFVAGVVVTLSYIVLGYLISLRASRRLFHALLRRLTKAPARFFDTTPVSRILARFTKDMETIDSGLQSSGRACITGVLRFAASFGVMLYEVPSFAPFALFIAWLYIRIAPPYIRASRDLRRLESLYLSPLFSGFDELHRGIVHVRAFGMERRYQEAFFTKVDTFQSFDHAYVRKLLPSYNLPTYSQKKQWLVAGWLRWRYDCLGSLVVVTATIFALWRGLSAGNAAIVITQAGLFADASRHLVSVAAQLELDFNSVERVIEYLDVDQEAPAIIEKNRPPAYWPSNSGSLVVENLVVRYAPKLPAVLHGLTFTVRPSEKIGVVGRTGSGKSTLAMSMLRMVEATEGRILIDGIDISTIGLEDLRTRITIISQDVALFTGTIRSNLDPLGHCTEEECMQALERCHLIPLLRHTPTLAEPTVLDMKVNTESLSAGERQLLALARATLRRTSIIIMDEATSQIDTSLDDQIQHTIREELAGSIVLTIAHRLKTVMDYDRILVLEDGRIVEFDSPKVLLQTPRGTFREMCRKSADWQLFLEMTGAGSQRSSSESSSSKP